MYRIGSLFTGYGGLEMGISAVINSEIAWCCDNDPAAAALAQHHRPETPNIGDITTVDWSQVEPVDMLADRERHPAEGVHELGRTAPVLAWGPYEPAIRRWGLILGRPAPTPTQTGQRGGQQLSPRFVEWMQGLPEGWVTNVPGLSRNDQLKLLGNGVVPQQASAVLAMLLAVEERAA